MYVREVEPYDAILIVSFGGPEKREDVIPFLENVTRGRGVPRERLEGVAHHYYHFDGRSPINDQVRALIDALRLPLPVYWGNRNWHPLIPDTLKRMTDDGIRRVLALATSAFGSYSGCRQYLENIEQARHAVGNTAPAIDKIGPFWDHPGFLEAQADRVRDALAKVGSEAELLFTAHSIPRAMAVSSPYVSQLEEACRRVASMVGARQWRLVYQSRSGPPSVPWLEPDVCDYLRGRAGRDPIIVVPIGFLSDHIEVLWDLDEEAASVARESGIYMERAGTVGTHPKFVEGLRDLIQEHLKQGVRRCGADCCPGQNPTAS